MDNRFARVSLRCTLLVLVVLIPSVAPVVGETRSRQLLGAFFYPWYGHYRHWNLTDRRPTETWASNFLPTIFSPEDRAKALYDSNDTRVVLWQLAKMKQTGLDFVVSSWWGQGSYEDKVIRKILTEVVPRNDNPFPDLKWSIVYDSEIFYDPTVDKIVGDLEYIAATFGPSKSILRIHGKIVLFVSGGRNDELDYAHRWSEAAGRVGGFYLILKAFRGHSSVAGYADGWYQFAPTNRFQHDEYYWGFASPGFSRYDEPSPRLSRSPAEFAMALQKLRESNVPIALIETWNDWNDGTQIEPGIDPATGESYGDLYVDLVRRVMKEEAYTLPKQPTAQLGILILTVMAILLVFPNLPRKSQTGREKGGRA